MFAARRRRTELARWSRRIQWSSARRVRRELIEGSTRGAPRQSRIKRARTRQPYTVLVHVRRAGSMQTARTRLRRSAARASGSPWRMRHARRAASSRLAPRGASAFRYFGRPVLRAGCPLRSASLPLPSGDSAGQLHLLLQLRAHSPSTPPATGDGWRGLRRRGGALLSLLGALHSTPLSHSRCLHWPFASRSACASRCIESARCFGRSDAHTHTHLTQAPSGRQAEEPARTAPKMRSGGHSGNAASHRLQLVLVC